MQTGVYETSRDDGRWTDIRDVQDWKCGAHKAQRAIKRPCHVSFFAGESVWPQDFEFNDAKQLTGMSL